MVMAPEIVSGAVLECLSQNVVARGFLHEIDAVTFWAALENKLKKHDPRSGGRGQSGVCEIVVARARCPKCVL